MINKVLLILKELIFDSSCPVCSKNLEFLDKVICDECLYKIKSKSLKNYKNIYFIWSYDDNIKKIIEDFKFNCRKELVNVIADLIKDKIEYVIKNEKIDIIIPVPVHQKRFNNRGFNHVEEVVKKLNLKYINARRNKNTKHMYKILNENNRVKNVNNVFLIEEYDKIKGKNVLIIDDIITTGSTIGEIEKVCYNYGANNVVGFVFAAAFYFQSKIKKENID